MISSEPTGQAGTTDAKAAPRRLMWALTIIPMIAFLATAVFYAAAGPALPASIAIHVGPDGYGFGSLRTTALVSLAVALGTLGFGTRYTLNRLKIGYWYMAEKTTAAAFISIGYASLAALLALLLGVWGQNTVAAQEGAFTVAILVFALTLIASMGVHAVILPRTRNFESL